jgi:two-component system cell cycle response regulator
MLPRLLIVDDETATRDALKRTLRGEFEILEASSADEALKVLKENKDIAVILTDEKMPHKSGTALLSDVRILYPRVARAMISGQVKIEQMMVAINSAEVHRFILKPWENEILRLQMQEALLFHHSLEEITRLEKLAITDPVTGLSNHRYFQEKIRKEMERSQRHSRVFSLMMVDVDHFKKFNDKFGHPEGDKALAQIAKLLKSATRTADSVSRYGGEEFALILPETAKPAAVEVADRIRRDLENISVSAALMEPHPITLSIGVSSFPDDGNTCELMISKADQALYRAKELGRNRVC